MSISELFYRRLIKSSLNLDERARIADCLASCAIEEKSSEWSSILTRKDRYKQALTFLHEHGYLKLELKNQTDLVAQLNSLASSSHRKAQSKFSNYEELLVFLQCNH